MRRASIFAAGCFATQLAFGASVAIEVGKKTYYVDTGTDGGVCRTRDVAEGDRETVCRDGKNVAALSSATGCLDSAGSGYCALGRLRARPKEAGSELTCSSGTSYFLPVGPDATCRFHHGEMTCQSADGKSSAIADCDKGCVRTTGAGNCCHADAPDCPPAND